MFGKKRLDYTQKLFDLFMSSRVKQTPFAFSTNDAVILTTDEDVYKELLSSEKYRNARNKVDGKRQTNIVEFKDLGLGKHEISKDIILRDELKNAALFSQLELQGCDSRKRVGGAHTIIITSSPDRIKDFLEAVIKQHVAAFGIDNLPTEFLESNPELQQTMNELWKDRYPYLFATMSLDNTLVFDSTLFETPDTIKGAVDKVSKIIDEKKNGSNCEEEKGED